MTWPAFPTNGVTTTINGVEYIYDGTNLVWNRVGTGSTNTTIDSVTVANLVVTQNTHLGNPSKIFINGGDPGLYLTGNGSGGLKWEPPAVGSYIANGTSNIKVSTNSNVQVSVNGTTNTVVFTNTGANITGYANITGDVTASNISASKLISTVISGTSPLTVSSTTRVANLNVDRANLSDYVNVQRQTTGVYYPTFVNGNATSNYQMGVSANLSFDISTSILTTKNITVTNTSNVDNLVASSNVITSNISVTSTANLIGSSVLLGANANVKLTGGVNGQYLQTDGLGNLSWTTVSLSNISNGTSNVSVASSGNVTIGAAGASSIIVVTSSGSNINGYANITGNITSAGNIDISGNVNASILTSNVSTGTSPLNITSTTRVSNLNVARSNVSDYTSVTNVNSGNIYIAFANNASTGNYALQSNTAIYANVTNANLYANNFIGNLTGIASSATIAGTVTVSSQPNITSIGALTGITSSGIANLVNTSNVSLGAVANVHISGGTSGQYLKTDGSGTLSWSGVALSQISNTNSNVSIPTTNGNINNYVNGTLSLVVAGSGANVTGYANITGNTTVGGNIDVVGNVNASVITSNVSTGTSPLNITSTTRVNNLNVARSNISDYTLVTTTASSNMYFTFANASSTANYSLYSNTAIYANLSAGSIYATKFVGDGSSLTGITPSTSVTVTASAQPNITSTGTLTSLTVSGLAVFGLTQDVTISGTPGGGVINYDVTQGVVYDVIPSASWTVNAINVPTTTNRVTVLTFIISQSSTAYVPTAFQIAGTPISVKWVGGGTPLGTVAKTDIVSYSIIRTGAGGWNVLGQYTSYG